MPKKHLDPAIATLVFPQVIKVIIVILQVD